MERIWLSFVIVALLTGGCASGRGADLKNIDWRSRMGTYTYGEALAEFGEPDVIGKTGDGIIAEWVLRRSPMVSLSFGFGGVGYGHHTSSGVGVGTSVSPPPGGEYLRLRFDADGKLTESSRMRY